MPEPPNPSGLCGCGCGQTTPRASYTSTKANVVRGEHLRFIPGHQRQRFAPEGKRWCRECRDFQPVDAFHGDPARQKSSGLCKEHRRVLCRTQGVRDSVKNIGLRRFGLTLEDYRQMLESQSGLCAICNRPETQKHQGGAVKHLAVDHCHQTGRVRGLLCADCNRLLGIVEDDPIRLQSAISYLLRYR